MFQVRLKKNPSVIYTVYAVVPLGPTAYFLVFADGEFELRHIKAFIPVETE